MFFHRWSYFCTQISGPWFQKRDQFSSLVPQTWYSLIPKKTADPDPVVCDPCSRGRDLRSSPSDPWSHPFDPWSHIPRYDPAISSVVWQQPRNLNSYRASHGVRSTKSCSGLSKSPAISGKPGALKGTNLRNCLSCCSCSEEDCPCILFTVLDLYLAWIKVLHLRYTELYSYFITFVWFPLCENVNCVLIVSPLNATLYYASPPIENWNPKAFGAQVF